MNMKRKIIVGIVAIIMIVSNVCASEKDDQIIFAMLMNQIQYSVATIQQYKNKVVLENEFDNIINKIDKTKLKDEDVLEAYENLLGILSNLKLNENERLFITQQAEKERKQAVNSTLKGTALPAISSAIYAGKAIASGNIGDAITAVSTLVYTGVSAAFNYRDAVNAVENSAAKELFKIDQSDLRTIDDQRKSLWSSFTKVINKYNILKEYEIKEDQMIDLVKRLAAETDNNAKIKILNEKRNIFAIFTPFWYELGSAYQAAGDIKNAKECYAEFERQKRSYSIIDNDTYYTELAKNMIQILHDEKNYSGIYKYINIIKKDKTVKNENANNFYLGKLYFTLKQPKQALERLRLVIDNSSVNYECVGEARELYGFISVLEENNNNVQKIYALSQIDIMTKKDISLSTKGVIVKFVADTWFTTVLTKIKDLFTDDLIFILPNSDENKYFLNVFFDGKRYSAIKNENVYSLGYDFKKLSKQEKFTLEFISRNEVLCIGYKCEYYSKSDLKKINDAFTILNSEENNKDFRISESDIAQLNIAEFLNKLKANEKELGQLKKASKKSKNTNDKKDNQTKARDLITKIYHEAQRSFLQEPYKYENRCFSPNGDDLFVYSIQSASAYNINYKVSKYGDIVAQ